MRISTKTPSSSWNTTFEVTASCPPQLQVFSRWGAKVYESAAYQNDWDGGIQPDGIYYYLSTTICCDW
ncbi:hypothetical protein F1C16_15145 [Hymenobacter sp. NBH84]|nr:hypothetical protein F1C16_15145 [Hymenobacter sp. NBH84]